MTEVSLYNGKSVRHHVMKMEKNLKWEPEKAKETGTYGILTFILTNIQIIYRK